MVKMDVATRFEQFNEWFKTPHGLRLNEEISKLIAEHHFFQNKQVALQVGSCGQNPWLFDNTYLLSPVKCKHADVITDPYHLPFGNHSVDALFAPFSLDLGLDVSKFLGEIDRVLVSMGYVMLLGLNPTGLWRMSRFFSQKSRNWYQYHSGCSYWKASHQLKQLGFSLQHVQFFYYLPPIQDKKSLSFYEWVNHFAKLIAPYPPAFYLVIMQKKIPQITPVIELEKTRLCQIR
jgi:hypothetical protein